MHAHTETILMPGRVLPLTMLCTLERLDSVPLILWLKVVRIQAGVGTGNASGSLL